MSAVPERSLETVARPPLTLVPEFEPQLPNTADLAERFKKFGNSFISAYDQGIGRLIEGSNSHPFNLELWHTYGRVALESLEIGDFLANFEQPTTVVVEKSGNPWDLSEKLLDVFKLLPQGLTDLQLSEVLGSNREAIHDRVHEILRKTGSSNRVQAGLLAYQTYKDEITPQLQVDLKLFDQLSPAEINVLGLLGGGLANKKIAERQSITLHTAKSHIKHLYRKLNITNKTSAAIFAYEANQASLLEAQTQDREEELLLPPTEVILALDHPSLVARLAQVLEANEDELLTIRDLVQLIDPDDPEQASSRIYNTFYDRRKLLRVLAQDGFTLEISKVQKNGLRRANAYKVLKKEDGRCRPSSDEAQPIANSKKENSPKRPSTMSLDNLAEDGFPFGFVEQIEELEEKLRHPPPHAEIVKLLRASGW